MLETLKYLCVAGCPDDKNVVGFTCSGGGATMLADHAEKIGLKFPNFESNGSEKIVELLPAIATVSNPLDYTTPIWGQPEKTGPVFQESMAEISGQSAILIQDYPAKGLDESMIFYRNDALAFAKAAANNNIPAAICSTIPENFDKETRELLIAHGVAPMQGIHEALNAISQAVTWKKNKSDILKNKPLEIIQGTSNLNNLYVLDEFEGKSLLKKMGFSVPKGRLTSKDFASKYATELGFPVVLKMVGTKIIHKTEVGAVTLNLNSTLEVSKALIEMNQSVHANFPEGVSESYLVEKMVKLPIAELIIGIRADPQFGLALTIGSGGIFVELIGDSSTLLLPTKLTDIEKSLKSLKLAKLLDGFRGKPKVNINLIAQEILKLALFAEKNINTIAEIEVNPMFVYEKSVVFVDVLIHAVKTEV